MIRMFMRYLLIFIGMMMLFAFDLFSQNNNLDLYNLSISDLAQLKLVTASKTEQNIDEVNATVRVITAKEIAERGYFSIDEILSDLPGFQFRDVRGINSYIFQRGVPNQNNLMLLLVDGVKINELNSGGFYGGAQYNVSDIERIEVVYGPASVAYGTNAVSGVVNLITKNSTNNTYSINALGGSFNTLKASGNFGLKLTESINLKLSAMGLHTLKMGMKGEMGDNNWTDLLDNFENNYSTGLKLNISDFTFGLNYFQKQASNATAEKSVGTNYRDFGTLWNISFLNTYLAYNKKLNEFFTTSAILYNRDATVRRNSVYYVLDTAQVGYYRPNNLTGIEAVVDFSQQKYVNVTSGIVVEYERLSESASMSYSNSMYQKPPVPKKPEMKTDLLFSFFIEPRIQIKEHLFLSGGVRYDYNTVYNQVFTPRFGLNYKFKKQLVRAFYAEAFRAPKPWDYTDGIGNINLMPEKMKSYEMSGLFVISPNLKLDAAVYYNILYNRLVRVYENEGYRWVNQTELRTQGVELGAKYSMSSWNIYANYTFTNSNDEHGVQVPEISHHILNAGFTCRLRSNVLLNIRSNYVGARKNPKVIQASNSFEVDSYFLLSGILTWQPIEQVSVQLIGKNMLNANYYHTSNRNPDRYVQPGSGFYVSLAYHLKP